MADGVLPADEVAEPTLPDEADDLHLSLYGDLCREQYRAIRLEQEVESLRATVARLRTAADEALRMLSTSNDRGAVIAAVALRAALEPVAGVAAGPQATPQVLWEGPGGCLRAWAETNFGPQAPRRVRVVAAPTGQETDEETAEQVAARRAQRRQQLRDRASPTGNPTEDDR